MTASAAESAFQQDIVRELLEGGWVLGSAAGYDRERALYTEDCPAFVKQTQPKVWEKFVALNGLPVATMELKSEFKQDIQNAIKQYKKTRLPKDSATNKPEPCSPSSAAHSFTSRSASTRSGCRRGSTGTTAVFCLSTRARASEGGAGNDAAQDEKRYATDYLSREVLARDSLLNILGRFVHLEIKSKEKWNGEKYKEEALIFPRYHQWDLVTKLLAATRLEGTGKKYLAQHSAGSGKSNSIAWTAHQLASLYDDDGEKVFHSVIVVTDRTLTAGPRETTSRPTTSGFDFRDRSEMSRRDMPRLDVHKWRSTPAGNRPTNLVTTRRSRTCSPRTSSVCGSTRTQSMQHAFTRASFRTAR